MGLKSKFPPDDLTLALGTAPTTLLDLTAAYAGVASGVAPINPYGVIQAKVAPTRRLAKAERDGLLEMMRATLTFGTGMTGNVSPFAYGKTGTTQDYRDAIFVGFIGDLVVGVWVGNDDNSPMAGVVGGGLPAEIWRDFVREAMGLGVITVNGKKLGAPRAAPPPETIEVLPLDVPPLDGVIPPEGVDAASPPVEAPPPPAEPSPAEPPF
jgi:penicillin-binding protein 1A